MKTRAFTEISRRRSGISPHLFFLLCFLPFPLALLIPARVGVVHRYDIEIPVLMWAAVAAFAGLATRRTRTVSQAAGQRPGRGRTAISAAIAASGFGLLLAWRVMGSSFADILIFSALFLIPIHLLLGPETGKHPRFGRWLALLWLVHALHGLWQLKMGLEVVGVTGNRNWLAVLLVATAPWAWQEVVRDRRGNMRRLLWGLLVGGITLLLVWFAASRAVVLAAGVYIFFSLIHLNKWGRWRFLAAGMVLAAALTGLVVKHQAIANRLAEDVRGPMWLSTLEMIGDHPLAGVGPGNFRKRFTHYRSALQMRSPKAASTSFHPHNEGLHVAAVGGVLLAILWGVLALSLLRWPTNSCTARAIHFSAFMLVGCGMLDVTLFMAPTAVLGLVMLGLHLRQVVHLRLAAGTGSCPVAPREGDGQKWCFACPLLRYGLLVLAVILAGLHTGRKLQAGWHFRQANMALDARDYDEAYASFLKAYTFLPEETRFLYEAMKLSVQRLNNPRQAIQHGLDIQREEPDVAHLNWLMAKAYERSGSARKALYHYKRESELFPFNSRVQSVALDRFLRVKALETALDIRSRLALARWWELINQLGEAEARNLADQFLSAVQNRKFGAAVQIGNRMLALMPPQAVCEPAAKYLASLGHPGFIMEKGGFSGSECPYWLQSLNTPESLSPDLSKGEAGLVQALSQGLELQRKKSEKPTPLHIAEAFRLAGWMAAAISAESDVEIDMLELRWNDWSAVVVLPDRVIPRACAGDLFHPEFRRQNGIAGPPPEGIKLRVPVRAADYWSRNQIIGDILRQGKSTGRPVLGESPTLYLWLYQALTPDHEAPEGKLNWEPVYR